MHEFCNISSNIVSITVIKSTFNEYGEQYFVAMDNNFVKDVITNNPLKGIHDGIWILKSDEAIMGSVHLTIDASKKFLNQSAYNQSAYFDNLLNELAVKVPINRSRLSSNNRFYKVFNDQIVILIRINTANNETERTALDIFSDLNTMIIYKNITTFSLGVTNDLDQDYGFKPICELIISFKNTSELNFYA
ncbi:804_t:CDS:2 [Scutellospora calospora]|uniref:804_t:CDS:1 n=1 Tax=Scutellospora calospora TaxID=85575 RepID=A0ACA9KBA7_9GLOM|nr:804_t:CDS:2 [Scutellospora calospora]